MRPWQRRLVSSVHVRVQDWWTEPCVAAQMSCTLEQQGVAHSRIAHLGLGANHQDTQHPCLAGRKLERHAPTVALMEEHYKGV